MNTTVTMPQEMAKFYEMRLIDEAKPNLVHDQFGDIYPLPKGSGKTVNFRRFSPLPKATAPLTEGVTPQGRSITVTSVESEVNQWGDWSETSDMLNLTALDMNILQTTAVLASQAGRTLDTVTREVLCGGTNVRYAPTSNNNAVESRADITADCKLTTDLIFKAKTDLSAMNTPKINGDYVAIIHPYVAHDLMASEGWIDVHKYASPENIFNGEIGKLGGVRFVETSEAKIVAPAEICSGVCRLYLDGDVTASKTATITEELTGDLNLPFDCYVNGVENQITAVNGTTVTFKNNVTASEGDIICGKGAGKDGSAVFITLVLGAHAYGTTSVEGGGLEHIVKPLGYGNDPLNQRSSCGWKSTKAVTRLVEPYMVRIESGASEYSAVAESN